MLKILNLSLHCGKQSQILAVHYVVWIGDVCLKGKFWNPSGVLNLQLMFWNPSYILILELIFWNRSSVLIPVKLIFWTHQMFWSLSWRLKSIKYLDSWADSFFVAWLWPLQVKGKGFSKWRLAWHWFIVVLSGVLTVATCIAAVRYIISDSVSYHAFADIQQV